MTPLESIGDGNVGWVRKHYVLCSALLCTASMLTFFVFGSYRLVFVNGSSMEPTYKDGEQLIAATFASVELERDYPVCWVKLDDGNDIIKRLIGYPGDIVVIDGYYTFVNGELIYSSEFSDEYREFEVPDGQYLFLGDNRADSIDGRYWVNQFVREDNIIAVVLNSGLK